MPIQGEYYYSAEGVYLNKAGEVVYGRKSSDRVIEIVAPGGYVSMDVAKRYNLVSVAQPEVVEDHDPAPDPVPVEEDKEPQPIGGKAVAAPAQNKAKAGAGKK